MAEDTGGRAFFDSNSFGAVFDRVVNDTSAYYVLGYSSTNPARDGRFRRIKVRLKRTDLKLEYRSGYYAPRDFAHSTKDDREQQLQDQLLSDLSSTDLSAYVSTAYFRLADNRYFVPLSVDRPRLPDSASPGTTPKDKATVDVLGVVRDEQRRPVGRIRDTVQAVDRCRRRVEEEDRAVRDRIRDAARQVSRQDRRAREPGRHVRLVRNRHRRARPAARARTKVSSVVVGTQLQQASQRQRSQPAGARRPRAGAERDARRLGGPAPVLLLRGLRSGAAGEGDDEHRVLSRQGPAPSKRRSSKPPSWPAPTEGPRCSSSTCPPSSLRPGLYTCQVNVVDDAAGSFTFPRLQLYVRR